MSIFQLACAALGGTAAAPNVVTVPSGTSLSYSGASAGISFNSNGSYSVYYNGVPIVDGYWITPQTNMSDYEIRATLDSGDTPDTGTQGSWLALSTSREWTQASASGIETSSLTFEIRWTGDNTVQDTNTFVLTASDSGEP